MRTRIVSLLSVVALAMPAAASAQVPLLPHPTFGVLVAANVSNVSGSAGLNPTSKVGFSVGAFVRMPMMPFWSFQPELEFATKGFKTTNGLGSGTLASSYVELPLLFRVATPSTPVGQVFAVVGPALSAKVACTVTFNSTSSSCADAGSDVKSIDMSGMIGAGYEFTNGLALSARYDYGFSDLASNGSSKNRNLQFVAGLRF